MNAYFSYTAHCEDPYLPIISTNCETAKILHILEIIKRKTFNSIPELLDV